MGFIKTSLAVCTGILGACGLIAAAKHLSESGAFEKVKDRAAKAADAVRGKSEKKAETTEANNA